MFRKHSVADKHERLTVERNPGEARTSTQTTRDLINPSVVELHPFRFAGAKMAGLHILPKAFTFEVLAGLNRVDRPFPLQRQAEKLDSTNQNRAGRWAHMVLVATKPQY